MAKSSFATVIGIVFIIIGLIGLFIGIVEYSIWNHNNEVMQHNEALGHYSQELRDLVRFQLSIVVLGIVFGTIFLILGTYLLWESPIDRLTNKLNQIFSTRQSPPSSPLPPFNNTLVSNIPIEEEEDIIIVDEESVETCSRCGEPIEKSWVRCPSCLLPLKVQCPKCNEEIDASWRACPHCGYIKNKKTIIKKV